MEYSMVKYSTTPCYSGMKIREILTFNLKQLLAATDLSQNELAHRAGTDRIYVGSLERCGYAAGIDLVDRLATELGVEAVELLRRPEDAK